MWFTQLLAYGLASTMIMYTFGALLIYKLRLTRAAKIVGFFLAWLIMPTAAILMATEPTLLSAQQEAFTASAVAVIIALFVVSVISKRNSSTRGELN